MVSNTRLNLILSKLRSAEGSNSLISSDLQFATKCICSTQYSANMVISFRCASEKKAVTCSRYDSMLCPQYPSLLSADLGPTTPSRHLYRDETAIVLKGDISLITIIASSPGTNIANRLGHRDEKDHLVARQALFSRSGHGSLMVDSPVFEDDVDAKRFGHGKACKIRFVE